MSDYIYAKWDRQTGDMETLQEHTMNVLNNVQLLKESYGGYFTGDTWKLVQTAARYHDAGKIYDGFQLYIHVQIALYFLSQRGRNIKTSQEVQALTTFAHSSFAKQYMSEKENQLFHKILPQNQQLSEEELRELFRICKRLEKKIGQVYPNVSHAFISLFSIPFLKMNLAKKQEFVLKEAVAYHHVRNVQFDAKQLNGVMPDINSKIQRLEQELLCEINQELNTTNIGWKEIKKRDKHYTQLVLVKGLLNRVDHAASAGELVEYHAEKGVGDYVSNFLKQRGHKPRELQAFTKEHQNQNIVVVAQTGMGKTEAALFWINDAKGFITLPIRVSLNALYERVTNDVGYKDEEGVAIAGLLHSGSVDFLQTLQDSYEFNELMYEQSRLLSKKLTFSTIDQVLKFPFLFRGYEKYLATMAYSKLVLDEIQGYSPEILAVILKALEMIHQMGGKFMIMTATLPTIFRETMEKRRKIDVSNYVYEEFFNDDIRHCIAIRRTKIDSDIEAIRYAGKTKRVLIIANTVKEAKRIYGLLKDDNAKLLHTHFIKNHRSILEEEIKKFAPNDKNRPEQSGIWIATQLVEASLDIDFDLLYTEISTLDSLFQRLGRCYRGRIYKNVAPNVFVYTEAEGLGSVYDKEIVQFGLQLLDEYKDHPLHEKVKMELVQTLYRMENLSEEYINKFHKALKVLDDLPLNDMTNADAQELLRKIENYQVIPRAVYKENKSLFSKYKQEHNKKELKILKMQIENLTTSISKEQVKKSGLSIENIDISGLRYIHILDCDYDFNMDTNTGVGIILS